VSPTAIMTPDRFENSNVGTLLNLTIYDLCRRKRIDVPIGSEQIATSSNESET
jgi:hypothetical protein